MLSIEAAIQDIVGEALEQAGYREPAEHDSLAMFADLRREFPQATIATLSLSHLLAALHTSTQNLDE
jgi:hypothetical protein